MKYIIWDKDGKQIHRGPWSKAEAKNWIGWTADIFCVPEQDVNQIFVIRKFHTFNPKLAFVAGVATGVSVVVAGILSDRVVIEKGHLIIDTKRIIKES